MIFEDSSKSPKIIKGLSSKDILLSVGDVSATGRSNIKYSFFKKVSWRIQRILMLLSSKVVIVHFLVEFFKYIVIRSGIILTVLSVINDLLSVYLDFAKRFLVNKLFWGRGKLLRFTAQFLGVLLLLLTFMSYTYKTSTSDNAEHDFQYIYAAQNDLLVQSTSTNTQLPTDRSRMNSEDYIVKVGDTLGTIAEYYGLNLETVLWANDLSENAVIKPGETLKIPPGNGLNVTVQQGDNIEILAKRYESSPQMIIDVNWLDYPFTLQTGQELFVPDGKKPEPVKPAAPVYSGIVRQRAGPLASSQTIPGVGRFLSWPVAGGGTLLQCYSGWHNGIDISGAMGTNIIASAPGVVTFAGCQSGSCPSLGSLYGGWGLAWTVVVDHGNGLSTVYGHLRNIYVSSGQSVSTGQALGEIGSTGTAYGLHVHYMVLQGGSWRGVNPAPYMINSVCGY